MYLKEIRGGKGNTEITFAYVGSTYNNRNLSMTMEDDCYYQVNANFKYNTSDTNVRQSCYLISPDKQLTVLYGSNATAGGASWSYVYISGNTLYMRGTHSGYYTDFIVTKIK